MTKTEAQAWRDRWKAVNEFQEAEKLQSTMEQRWRETNSLRMLADELSLPMDSRNEAAKEVSRRWVLLHERGGK